MTLQLSPATKAVREAWNDHKTTDVVEVALAASYMAALRADADSQIEALSKHVATSAIHEQALWVGEDAHAEDMEEAACIERERDYYAAAWRELAYLVDSAWEGRVPNMVERLRDRVMAHRRVAARNGWHELGVNRGEPAAEMRAERLDDAQQAQQNAEERLAKALSTIAVLRPAATAWDKMLAHLNETPAGSQWMVNPPIVASIISSFRRTVQAEQVEQLADETVQEIEEARHEHAQRSHEKTEEARRIIREHLDAEHANDAPPWA